MFKLPEQLRYIENGEEKFEIFAGDGHVIKADKYVKTLVSGHGGGGHISSSANGYIYGNIHSVRISTQSVVVSDIWIRDIDGQDVNCILFDSPCGFLENHNCRYMIARTSNTKQDLTIFLKNYTLNKGYIMNFSQIKIIKKNNPSGFFKNPSARQQEFEKFYEDRMFEACQYIMSNF